MGLYAGDPAAWVNDIYQFEETDVVQGGPTGIDNVPLKNLADRTAWLKDQLGLTDRLTGSTLITASGAITPAHSGHLVTAAISAAVLVLTLDAASTFKEHTLITISAFEVGGMVKVTGPIYRNVGGNLADICLHNNEFITLKAEYDGGAGFWRLVNATGNMFSVGEEVKARKVLPGTFALQGQLLSRTIYKRLFDMVSTFTTGEEVVTDADWLSDPLLYRSCFSLGDGVTTFRLPDERGMFERMLDGGRNVDTYRAHNFAGGYEADALKSHNHTTHIPVAQHTATYANIGVTDGPPGTGVPDFPTSSTGTATENIVKNIGKYNLIKY